MRVRKGLPLSRPVRIALAIFVAGILVVAGILLFSPPDWTPPLRVVGVEVLDRFDGRLDLRWLAGRDDVGVAGYRIYRDDRRVAEVPATPLNFTDTGLPVDVAFEYQVSALDRSRNEGPRSDSVFKSSAPRPPLVTFTDWRGCCEAWELNVSSVSHGVNLTHFDVSLVVNDTNAAIGPLPVLSLPASRDGLRLEFRDRTGDGRLSALDAFEMSGTWGGSTFTLALFYVPSSEILQTATLLRA